MTPFFRSAPLSDSNLFSAPRSLKEAVNWRFSNFRKISAPEISDRMREWRAGVCFSAPAILAGGGLVVRGGAGRVAALSEALRRGGGVFLILPCRENRLC